MAKTPWASRVYRAIAVSFRRKLPKELPRRPKDSITAISLSASLWPSGRMAAWSRGSTTRRGFAPAGSSRSAASRWLAAAWRGRGQGWLVARRGRGQGWLVARRGRSRESRRRISRSVSQPVCLRELCLHIRIGRPQQFLWNGKHDRPQQFLSNWFVVFAKHLGEGGQRFQAQTTIHLKSEPKFRNLHRPFLCGHEAVLSVCKSRSSSTVGNPAWRLKARSL